MNTKYVAMGLVVALTATGATAGWDRHDDSGFAGPGRTVVSTGRAKAWGNEYTDYAKVISAEPIYETVQVSHPQEQCWDERVVHGGRPGHSPVRTIAGGIIGGVVGNQFGRGRGKTAMTVAGTLLGAAIGHEASYRPRVRSHVTYEERCEWVDQVTTEERLVGYRVKYRYKGENFVTRTDEHPGRRIPIRVSVEPARHL